MERSAGSSLVSESGLIFEVEVRGISTIGPGACSLFSAMLSDGDDVAVSSVIGEQVGVGKFCRLEVYSVRG